MTLYMSTEAVMQAGMQTDDVAVVALSFVLEGKEYEGAGSSKRATGEKRNPVFGYKLALVRALQGLMDDLLGSEGFELED